jgi:hypothetical protein
MSSECKKTTRNLVIYPVLLWLVIVSSIYMNLEIDWDPIRILLEGEEWTLDNFVRLLIFAYLWSLLIVFVFSMMARNRCVKSWWEG